MQLVGGAVSAAGVPRAAPAPSGAWEATDPRAPRKGDRARIKGGATVHPRGRLATTSADIFCPVLQASLVGRGQEGRQTPSDASNSFPELASSGSQ